jgi:hypothetical protein
MKTIRYSIIIPLILTSCIQEMLVPGPDVQPESCGLSPSAGSMNVAKFIAIGDSYLAGFQAGAWFTDGQNESLPRIIARQFECVGGSSSFNQPTVNSSNGCFNPAGGCTLGRLILFDGGSGPAPVPSGTSGVPAPYNTADGNSLAPFTGNATLNNISAPGAKLLEAVNVPNYGTLNPYYGRFAASPTDKTMLVDAVEKGATFFMMWLGLQDVLAYATNGAAGSENGTNPSDMTPLAVFQPSYAGALNAMLASSAGVKGVVGNIPDVTLLPYFRLIDPLAIKVPQGSRENLLAGLTQLNAAIGGWNAAIDAHPDLTPEQKTALKRPLLSTNFDKYPVIIYDPALSDAEVPTEGGPFTIPKIRNANASDGLLFCLTAQSVLSTGAGISPLLPINEAQHDAVYLTKDEQDVIKARIGEFNQAIAGAVNAANAGGTRVALADINEKFAGFVASGSAFSEGVLLTPGISPPTAAYSEDGVHPNGRGYAFAANVFIDAMNSTFGAMVPKASILQYKGTRLPLTLP